MAETESRTAVQENGISLIIPADKRRTELLKYYNPKLSLLREVVSGTLKVEVDSCDKSLFCLEADLGSGVAALQWKKRHGESIQVIVAEKKLTMNVFEQMCAENGLKCAPWTIDPDRIPGEWCTLEHGQNVVHPSPFSANVTLMQEAFNFVYIQPNNSIAANVDATFANLRHNGVACFVSPNISSQCFRCPQLIRRLYLAHVQKTEYVKEMAVRLVVADIVKSASRHYRGVEVLYTVCLEDHFLIAVRVAKKNQAAIDCTAKIRPLLHCLMCEERVVYPDVHSPVELPYSLLPCDCKEKNPGKTAVVLGPMWTGNIFNVPHLRKIVAETKAMFPKSRTSSVLQTILTEAVCSSSGQEENPTRAHRKDVVAENGKKDASKNSDNEEKITSSLLQGNGDKLSTIGSSNDDDKVNDIVSSEGGGTEILDTIKMYQTETGDALDEPAEKKRKVAENDNTANMETNQGTEMENEVVNQASAADVKPVVGTEQKKSHDIKRSEKAQNNEEEEDKKVGPMPMFYRDLHKQKGQKHHGLPRSDKLVRFLRQEGYRASRTHFEEHAIRTEATGKQMEAVVAKFIAS